MQIKDVLRRWLEAREIACGQPIANLKANGGVRNGKLNWLANPMYRPTYDADDDLIALTFTNGDSINMPKGRFKKVQLNCHLG